MHTALQQLSPEIKSKLVAGVLFGDTLNQRNRHQIPGFPADRVKEFCADGDGICEQAFRGITAAHLSYSTNSMDRQAVDFLVAKLNGRPAQGGEVKGGAGGAKSGRGKGGAGGGGSAGVGKMSGMMGKMGGGAAE
jgi:Cutinase